MTYALFVLLQIVVCHTYYQRGRRRGQREARLRGYELLTRQARSLSQPEPSADTDWAVEVTYNIINPEE